MNRAYEERIFSGPLAILPGGAGVALLGIVLYTRLAGVTANPVSIWFLLGTGLFLLLVAFNFAFLNIRVSPRGVSARFGIFRHVIPLSDVAGFSEDKASSLSYGGFGIRFARVNGKPRLVYNTARTPRIVIEEGHEGTGEFVFSTRNPEALMKALGTASGLR